jgi:hypothetical protein
MDDLIKIDQATAMPRLEQKYTEKLEAFQASRDKMGEFIKSQLVSGKDFGITTNQKNAKPTLMKSGAEKIVRLADCKILTYPDFSAAKMLGIQGFYLTAYIIDAEILKALVHIGMEKGFESIEPIVKLFAWGEGRGAYESSELTYSSGSAAGQPLKGTANRAVKMAEKRAKIDAVISTFGLEFSQDMDEYTNRGTLKGDHQAKPVKSEKEQKADKKLDEQLRDAYNKITNYLTYVSGGNPVFTGDLKKQVATQANRMKSERDLKNLTEYVEAVKNMANEIMHGGQNAEN